MRLFLEHGYGKVTVADIAREASLAVPTVYTSVGGKSAVLATLIDEAMRDPVVDETLSAIRECGSPLHVIAVTAHGVRVDNERYHDIVQVMTTAAAIDDAATEILIRSDHGVSTGAGPRGTTGAGPERTQTRTQRATSHRYLMVLSRP
jgi:AcrR family transcriptional regulator